MTGGAVYLSYDGALDPLGSSQAVAYVLGLAKQGVPMALVSFEKPARLADETLRHALAARLAAQGVAWYPLHYHARPRLPATAWDIWLGGLLVKRLVTLRGARLVHCRGDVAMAMARAAGLPAGIRLLYDVRGLFSEERAQSGSWTAGGALDHFVRRIEAGNLLRADALVTLTQPALEAVAARRDPLPPHRIIPTCVDLEAFRPRDPGRQPDYGLAYVGSLGTWYLTGEMVAFANVAREYVPGRVLFLTPQVEEARRAGAGEDWADVRAVPPAEVPAWIARARASFFFIRPIPAKRASSPTKLGEALACGLPVVANAGVGDFAGPLLERRCGVLVDSFEEAALRAAAARLAELLADPDTPRRCRALATEQYGLDRGVGLYAELYRELGVGP